MTHDGRGRNTHLSVLAWVSLGLREADGVQERGQDSYDVPLRCSTPPSPTRGFSDGACFTTFQDEMAYEVPGVLQVPREKFFLLVR